MSRRGDSLGHEWHRGVQGGNPTLECGLCGLVWMPNQNMPRARCAALRDKESAE